LSRLGDWLDLRTGHRALLSRALDEPIPGGARWGYVWGSALTLSLGIQAVTGWLLMSAYAPSATTAWASVAHLTFAMRLGWLVRGLHHFGAQAMVVLLVAHLAQTALLGAYRKPREVNWYFGLSLLAVTLAFALTGYLLPWDQKGYWATRVATSILGSLPVAGAWLEEVVVGGPAYGHLTLTHFYALHVGVLPAVTAALVAGHIALFRKHGITTPVGADASRVDLFYPKQVARDLVVGVAVLGVLVALAVRAHGAPLDAPADPSSDYPARPEWYFLPLFELLKHLSGALEPVGALGVPLLVIAYLVALPLLDTGPDRRASSRARARLLAPLAVIALGALLLGLRSWQVDAADPGYQQARRVASARAERAITLARAGVPPEGPLAMLRADAATRGPDLFAKHCASCHRLGELSPPEGKVGGPDLTGFGTRAWVLGVLDDPDAAHRFGRTPFKGMMPSMTRPPADPEAAKMFTAVSPADREAVAAFLEAEARGQGAKGSPGEAVARKRCTVCHRLDGKTDDDDALGPELRGWASAAWIEAQIESPAGGRAYPKGALAPALEGHMPAFAETLSAGDRRVLAAWVAATGAGGER
jgi:ubiquinol-cytochrome c reductase cytochrome b subunit